MTTIQRPDQNRTAATAHAAASPGGDLRQTIEREILPRLLSLHGVSNAGPGAAGGAVPGPATGTFVQGTPDLSARLSIDLALDSVGPNPDRVDARLDRLLEGGADPADLCVHLLAPAARHLGQLWTEDRLDFVDVTLGTMRLERSLRGLLSPTRPRRGPGGGITGGGVLAGIMRAPTILMLPLSGNQHTFGLTMAADFFRRAGWIVSDATACGPADDPQALERHLRLTRLDAIGLAVSCETQLERLTRCLRMIRACSINRRIRIALGGPLFLVQPAMASRLDADLVVTDGSRAPFQLAALLPEADRGRDSQGPDAMVKA